MSQQQKQISGILSDINRKGPELKLGKCLAVHNEEDWVEFNLRNCYEEFDIIRVVEGAVEGRPGSTSDGHSTDRTLELIRAFPDPDGKIELYTGSRHFKSLEEQKQTFIDHAKEGEWLFIIDCDEFYMEGDIDRVRKAIKTRPSASEIIPTFLHFYRDFFHIKAPHPEWQMQHQRIVRYRPGLKYHTHPVLTDGQGRCTYFTPGYQLQRFTIPNLFIFHYGHAKGKEFHQMKKAFYQSELEKFKLADGTTASDKFDDKFVEFMTGTEPTESILEYKDVHPTAMDSHPSRHQYAEEYADEREFSDWRENFVFAADYLPTIALFMMGPWQRTKPVYNVIKV